MDPQNQFHDIFPHLSLLFAISVEKDLTIFKLNLPWHLDWSPLRQVDPPEGDENESDAAFAAVQYKKTQKRTFGEIEKGQRGWSLIPVDLGRADVPQAILNVFI